MRNLQPLHLENSLSAIAQVALRETNATGYALFEGISEAPGLVRLSGLGTDIPVTALLEEGSPALIAFPLHTGAIADGFVAFSFPDHATSVLAEEPLSRLLEAIETIWAARQLDGRYRNLLRRLSKLEAQLIDSKITDRVRGFLAGEGQPDIVDSMVRHVKTVLRPSAAGLTLETILKQLEEEIDERRVTSQAKAILQTAHSLSEEQAYTQLRVASRKSRRRLKEVAMDVMAQYTLEAKTA